MKSKIIFSALFLITACLSSFAQNTINELVGHWKFDGDFQDASAFSNHGTCINVTLTEDRFGKLNSAGSFNESDAYIDVPTDPSLDVTTECTFSAWILMKTYKGARIVDKQTAGASDGYSFDVNAEISEQKTFRLVGGGVNCYSPQLLELNTWYHVTAVYERGTVSLYINGEFVSSQTGSQNAIVQNAYSLRIGAAHPNSVKPEELLWNGSLDDVRIYRKALNETQVFDIYNESGVGIAENIGKKATVYPNPSAKFLNFSGLAYDSMEIYSSTGTKILSQDQYQENVAINNLTRGTYLLRMISGDHSITQSFVKAD